MLGGHEHEVMLRGTESCRVVKAGSDASTAAVVTMDVATGAVDVVFEDVTSMAPERTTFEACEAQLGLLRSLENEIVLELNPQGDPEGGRPPLSSERTRFQQTTVGERLCSAARDWMRCDAATINGGSIKGGKTYDTGALSFLDLKKELPFPTKLVVVDMPGRVFQDAVLHSRTAGDREERRAYLQVCDAVHTCPTSHRILRLAGAPFDPDRVYAVALPRNLMKGIFHIAPLVAFADAGGLHENQEDDFVPAINAVLMRHAKDLWTRLGAFDDMDLDGDGVLTRKEVELAIYRRRGVRPPEILLDNVMAALDADHDGTISRAEFEDLFDEDDQGPWRITGP